MIMWNIFGHFPRRALGYFGHHLDVISLALDNQFAKSRQENGGEQKGELQKTIRPNKLIIILNANLHLSCALPTFTKHV